MSAECLQEYVRANNQDQRQRASARLEKHATFLIEPLRAKVIQQRPARNSR
jgi:hypothetical protein